jgi:hypothetical protein
MPSIVCPFCHRKLRVPDHLTGRRVSCPRCHQAVAVPIPPDSLEEVVRAASAEVPSPPAVEAPLPVSVRLGIVGLGLGLFSVLLLCLPVLGYASPGLSGAGLLLSLAGLVSAPRGGTGNYSLAGAAGGARAFGARARDYPLAGVGVCLLALALALWPLLRG